ncbi:MAG: hypothetical protein KC442_18440 [Thermomicrobiales bacterium]|nr:hypothetical protein [Thermomicrobiales bacterium]
MANIEAMLAEAVGHPLPPPLKDPGLEGRVQAAVAAANQVIVALDDDPTGVQTVHDVPVITGWDEAALAAEMARREHLFFVLTNSRSLPAAEASELSRQIAERLRRAAAEAGRGLAIVSRSDSTLRGHFPAETDALAAALGGVDGVLLCPAFFEGGRVTVDDTHFVVEAGRVGFAADTEFARDATFGYRARTLPAWVEEKSGERIPASRVASITLEDIRIGGADRVANVLMRVRGGQPVILNALNYADLWAAVLGILRAEAAGKRFLYRGAASLVRARAGVAARPLLSRDELLPHPVPTRPRGLVIVGSHVQRSSEQLSRLLTLPGVTATEVRVPELLASGVRREAELARAAAEIHDSLVKHETPVVFTSRTVERPPGVPELDVARSVSAALVELVRGLRVRPDFVIGKGGITSSDVGARGLGARRAVVLGQVWPGVPVWRIGEEGLFPGLSYVVFPGNVGAPDTLREMVADLLTGNT